MLKIGTYAETKGGGTSFLGLFNIAGQRNYLSRSSADFAESDRKSIVAGTGAQRYLIRSHQTSDFIALIDVTQKAGRAELVYAGLPAHGYEILSAHPVHRIAAGSGSTKSVDVAVLGLMGKMTGAAAILATAVSATQEGGLHISTELKALGVLGLWVSGLESLSPSSVVRVMMAGKKLDEKWTRVERISGGEESAALVEIDLLGAWRHMGLRGASGDVLDVEVMV